MIISSAYARLMRLNKPIGIFLLWYPTAWALWIAFMGHPPKVIIVIFALGTLFMRSAGCVMNDIADKNIDIHVQRTKNRPLTAGELSINQSLFALGILLMSSALLLFKLPLDCFYLAIVALLISGVYPFCKRYLQAPQLVLGIAFSMGIPMVFAATGDLYNAEMGWIMAINFTWIVAYDTMYAMTDKEDDLKIGVKSTAIYFANFDKLMIGLLLGTCHFLWLVWGIVHAFPVTFYVFWIIGLGVILYQQKLISHRVPEDCFKAFLISNYYGLVMWISLITSY